MAHSHFILKALTTVLLVYFSLNISYYTAKAIEFFWQDVLDWEDSDFEDLDTECFLLPDKCPPPPCDNCSTPPPQYDN